MEANKVRRSTIRHLLRNVAGQGVLEYALLLLLVTVVLVAILKAFGETLNIHWYQPINSAVTEVAK